MKVSTILVTGGSGFIGTNFIRYLFALPDFTGKVVNLDLLTYAGNPMNLADIEEQHPERYRFIQGDIRNAELVQQVFHENAVDVCVHFAAESHVDRSIAGPADFISTNITGTFNLLEAARACWTDGRWHRFHHVSTDEVFGSLGKEGYFTENTAYDPRSPYSASKASSDHLVRAYFHTYDLPVTISNCSNNYGPFQFPEKLLPLMINNMVERRPLPVYGDGKNIRDWLFVDDHSSAIVKIIEKGSVGETYTVGGENEWENLTLVKSLCSLFEEKQNLPQGTIESLITFVKDRPGHDRRYAIDCSKIKAELGWKQSVTFKEGLSRTIDWYLQNSTWMETIKTGAYQRWISKNYDRRNDA